MSIWVNAINQLSQLLGKPASWVKSHVTSKSYSIRYPGLTWQTDPRNNVGTFPGDKTTREYNMIVHFEIEIESEEGGGYYEIDVDTACQVKLYCVFARVPEPQETPGHDDQTNYEPVEPDVPGDYYPDPDDRPEPWEDNYDDYWDDRD